MTHYIDGILSEESLNIMCKEIDSSYNSCSKAIEAYNLVSNVKAMESFGYKATEGLGESIKNGAKAVVAKIKELIDKIVQFIKDIFTHGMVKNKAKKLLDKINTSSLKENDAFDFDKKIPVSAGMILKTTSLPEAAKMISALVSAFKAYAYKSSDNSREVLFDLLNRLEKIVGEGTYAEDGRCAFSLDSLGYKTDQDVKYFLKTICNDNCYIFTELKALQNTLTLFKNKVKETDDSKDKTATLNAIKAAYKLSKLGWNYIKVHMYVIERCIVDPDSSKEKE